MKKITTVLILVLMAICLISCDTFSRRTISVSVDRHPILTLENQTGFPIQLTSPLSTNINHGAITRFYPSPGGGQVNVSYVIGGYSFNSQVNVMNDIRVTLTERPPQVSIVNNTGFPITLTSPIRQSLANGANVSHFRRGEVNVVYTIGGYSFSSQITTETDDMTLALTERPPGVNIINNTGFPIMLTSPIRQPLASGGSVFHLRESPTGNPQHTVTYTVGPISFSEQVSINNADVTLSLTRSPPRITLVNNTGVTIINVFIRNPGTPWGAVNILGIQLNPDGTVLRHTPMPGDLVGSLTNMDRFTFWMGHLGGITGLDPGMGRFDIRLDDTHGVSYVMNNVAITNDVTLTFTQTHRP